MADKTVRIGVDAQEAQGFQSKMRQSAESLARDMIRSARSYSTSSKEVLKDIDAQIQAIEKRNRLDAEFRKARLESARDKMSPDKYSSARSQISQESREDQLQTKLLRELIDTIKHTSKEEIREDRKGTFQKVSRGGAAKLGVSGDELGSLKETIQYDELGRLNTTEAKQKRGFNLAGAVQTGRQVAGGDVGGASVGAGMGMARTAFSNPYTAIGAVALLAAGGTMLANKALGENLRGYGVSSQMSISEMADFRKSIKGSGYTGFAMTGNELLGTSVGYNKALGGRDFTGEELTGLTAVTKARDVNAEMFSQTLGFSRYSNSGGLTTVIQNLEDSIRKMYGGDDFKRKLVQLPEMMQVYNSLASQMISTVGEVNQQKLSSFVGGVGSTFGVEGQNLQRYSSGLKNMFGGGGNKFIGSIQSEIIRRKFPQLGGSDLYQKMLEVQQDPTSHPWFMEEMWNVMQSWGGGEKMSPEFRTWAKSGGFGAKEAKKMWGTEFESTKFNSQEGSSDKETFKKFVNDAEKYYAETEKSFKKIEDKTEDLTRFFGKLLENDTVKVTVVEDKVSKMGQTPNALYPQPKL